MLTRFTLRLRAHALNTIPLLTHALAALLPLAWAHALGQAQATTALILAAVVVGNLADVDTGYSHVGRLWPALSRFLERRFGHRTITHSLWAVALVTAAAYSLSRFPLPPLSPSPPWPSAWPWLPVFYVAHLFLDMIIGGTTGVPLLWPLPTRFYLTNIEASGTGERIMAVVLAVGCALPLAVAPERLSPAAWLHRQAGTLQFALQDYREWEPFYHVYADIEATERDTHRDVRGRYEIVGAEGDTLLLAVGDGILTAGQRDEDLYIRRIVAVRGEARPPAPPPTPTPEATPVYVKIRVENVYDLEREVLVKAGDVVTKGQLIADLVTYRRQIHPPTPTPTPSATPTPRPTPTPTWAPDPLALAKAKADLDLARAQYNKAVAPPSAEEIAAVCDVAEQLRQQLWQGQLERDAMKARKVLWLDIHAKEIALEALEGEIAQADAECAAIKARPHAASPEDVAIAEARLHQAEVAYAIAIATPTPRPTPTSPPTSTPTPVPTPTPATDDTRVYSLVAGEVTGVRITEIKGGSATVEIYIALPLPSTTGPQLATTGHSPSTAPSHACVNGGWNVTGISDGDTIRVACGDIEETVRLIGVDTPETKKPGGGVECYGLEATNFTAQLLSGKQVELELDTQERDKYGRLLAYVYLGEQMVNALLVEKGYARVADFPPNLRYSKLLHQFELKAQAEKRGLWGACQ